MYTCVPHHHLGDVNKTKQKLKRPCESSSAPPAFKPDGDSLHEELLCVLLFHQNSENNGGETQATEGLVHIKSHDSP